MVSRTRVTLERRHFGELLEALRAAGYRTIGPTLRDGAIVYDEVRRTEDLPVGWTDEQEAGRYRLRRRADEALFGYAVGPHSWKREFFPAAMRLWRAERDGAEWRVDAERPPAPATALLGVRPCELRAISIQDRVFTGGEYADGAYLDRRDSSFLIAVQCGHAAATCFCVSMDAGPGAESGFDLALTELLDEREHLFVVEVGSAEGRRILDAVPHRPASAREQEWAEQVVAGTARDMKRGLDTDGIVELLERTRTSSSWDRVAERCLACANCTMVCPTCFCSTVEDVTDLTGDVAERWRKWDSCFTMELSYLHGGSVRSSVRSRYRQWLTHKLGTWHAQFGSSGCVGCGRCITWCPVGIDLTEELRSLRDADEAASGGPEEDTDGDSGPHAQ